MDEVDLRAGDGGTLMRFAKRRWPSSTFSVALHAELGVVADACRGYS